MDPVLINTTIQESGFYLQLSSGGHAHPNRLEQASLFGMYRFMHNLVIDSLKRFKLIDRFGRPLFVPEELLRKLSPGENYEEACDVLFQDIKSTFHNLPEWFQIYPESVLCLPITNFLREIRSQDPSTTFLMYQRAKDRSFQPFTIPITDMKLYTTVYEDIQLGRNVLSMSFENGLGNPCWLNVESNSNMLDSCLDRLSSYEDIWKRMRTTLFLAPSVSHKKNHKLMLTMVVNHQETKGEWSDDCDHEREELRQTEQEMGDP